MVVVAEALDAVVSLVGERSEQGLLDGLVAVTRRLTAAQYGVSLLTGSDGRPARWRTGAGVGPVIPGARPTAFALRRPA